MKNSKYYFKSTEGMDTETAIELSIEKYVECANNIGYAINSTLIADNIMYMASILALDIKLLKKSKVITTREFFDRINRALDELAPIGKYVAAAYVASTPHIGKYALGTLFARTFHNVGKAVTNIVGRPTSKNNYIFPRTVINQILLATSVETSYQLGIPAVSASINVQRAIEEHLLFPPSRKGMNPFLIKGDEELAIINNIKAYRKSILTDLLHITLTHGTPDILNRLKEHIHSVDLKTISTTEDLALLRESNLLGLLVEDTFKNSLSPATIEGIMELVNQGTGIEKEFVRAEHDILYIIKDALTDPQQSKEIPSQDSNTFYTMILTLLITKGKNYATQVEIDHYNSTKSV